MKMLERAFEWLLGILWAIGIALAHGVAFVFSWLFWLAYLGISWIWSWIWFGLTELVSLVFSLPLIGQILLALLCLILIPAGIARGLSFVAALLSNLPGAPSPWTG